MLRTVSLRVLGPLGLLLTMGALLMGCPKKEPCGPQNCSGCCDSADKCVGTDSQGTPSCGTTGAKCAACGDGQSCTAGLCASATPDGGADGGPDAGPFDAGFKCRIDDDCEALDQGLRCDEKLAECVPARGCSSDTNCVPQGSEDPYCDPFGIQCRCVTETNDAGFDGVCRRRRAVCEPCTDDSQCGLGALFEPPGRCLPLQGDPTGKKYCFQAPIGSCSCGMTLDTANGVCKPQSNSCSAVGCGADKDCPGGSVCNKARCLCEQRCRWDFATKADAPPGCPPGKTCWVDSANLDPTSLFYGSGRCQPACGSDLECTDTAANPFGGANLKCAAEVVNGGGQSAKRCRANGECMDDLECPDQPKDSIYLGYCDRGSFTCKTDCRTGVDPKTNQSYPDCRSEYKCQTNGAGVNECVLKTCLERGGARAACHTGQYCCGEDKNGDGVADPCPPVAQRDLNGCYDAPTPPFCFKCQSNADCSTYTPPTWMTPCANGSKSPNCSTFPNRCIYGGDKAAPGDGVNICAVSTYDDEAGGKKFRGCPATYGATYLTPKFTAQGDGNDCTTNADCSVGHDAGICDFDLSRNFQDGGHPRACKCTVPGAKVECPNAADGGVTSMCKNGLQTPTVCVQTVICTPPPGLIYRAAGEPDFGCGL